MLCVLCVLCMMCVCVLCVLRVLCALCVCVLCMLCVLCCFVHAPLRLSMKPAVGAKALTCTSRDKASGVSR